jgi:hypothetical protein
MSRQAEQQAPGAGRDAGLVVPRRAEPLEPLAGSYWAPVAARSEPQVSESTYPSG